MVIDHAPEPARDTPSPVAARRRGGTPLPLTLLLTAGLGGGLYWVWTNPKPVAGHASPAIDPQSAIYAARAQLAGQVQSVAQQVQALSGRVDALEKQPAAPPAAPAGPDATAGLAKRLDEVSAQVASLSTRQDAQAGDIQKAAETAAKPAPDATAGLAKRLDDVSTQLASLSARQDAQAADIQKAAEAAARPAPDATPSALPAIVAQQAAFGHRLDEGLAQQKSAADALDQRVAKLEQDARQVQGTGQAVQDQGQALSQQKTTLDALDQRLGKLEQGSLQAAAKQDQAAQKDQAQSKTALAALDARVARLEQGQGAVQGVARDANRAVRVEAAQAALSAGQPLGDLPGAPPALARFATVAPPTESGLRAAWPAVAEAARAASQPDLSNRSFLDRALARMQQSVTVRRGDHVLVGDPAGGVLARAQQALDNGDLKGAVDSLGALNGPAAAATRDWAAQVHALLDARASLAAMARG